MTKLTYLGLTFWFGEHWREKIRKALLRSMFRCYLWKKRSLQLCRTCSHGQPQQKCTPEDLLAMDWYLVNDLQSVAAVHNGLCLLIGSIILHISTVVRYIIFLPVLYCEEYNLFKIQESNSAFLFPSVGWNMNSVHNSASSFQHSNLMSCLLSDSSTSQHVCSLIFYTVYYITSIVFPRVNKNCFLLPDDVLVVTTALIAAMTKRLLGFFSNEGESQSAGKKALR